MNRVESCCIPGNIAIIEQFTLAYEELRQFVVYTYYDKNEQPLYVGCSKEFYTAHYFNSQRLSFFDKIEYVGFVFFDNENDIKDARKYFIKARQPKYNKHKFENVALLPGLDPSCDDLVVYKEQMERRWAEWLNAKGPIDCTQCPYGNMECCFNCSHREDGFCPFMGEKVILGDHCSEYDPLL